MLRVQQFMVRHMRWAIAAVSLVLLRVLFMFVTAKEKVGKLYGVYD